MKKILSVLLCVLLLCACVVSCKDDNAENRNEDVTPPPQEVVLIKHTNEVVDSDLRYAIMGSYTDYVYSSTGFLRSEYNSSGGLVKETFYDSDTYLPHKYFLHTYNAEGQLSRSVMYEMIGGEDDLSSKCQYRYDDIWYVTYLYDEHGRPEDGQVFEDGRKTDRTIRFEYHDNGMVKKRSFYDGEYLTIYQVYDEKGRCVGDYGHVFSNWSIEIDYRGDTREISQMQLKEDEFVYSPIWNYKNGVAESVKIDDGDWILTESLSVDAEGRTLSYSSRREWVGEKPILKNVRYTYNSDFNIVRLENDYSGDKVIVDVEYNDKKQIISAESFEYDGNDLAYVNTVSYQYDDFERITEYIEEEYYNDNGTRVLEDKWVETYTYNENGLLIRDDLDHYDSKGIITYYTHIEYTYSNGEDYTEQVFRRMYTDDDHTTQYETEIANFIYDENKNLIKSSYVIYALDETVKSRTVVEYQYDRMDNLLLETYTCYDEEGKEVNISRYDTKGTLREYTYTYYNKEGTITHNFTNRYDEYGNTL